MITQPIVVILTDSVFLNKLQEGKTKQLQPINIRIQKQKSCPDSDKLLIL